MKEKKKIIRRFPPCSYMDIERLESWLTDMAAQGWHLKEIGIWKIVFIFEEGEPKNVRYRLEPRKGAWDGEMPEEAAQELFRDLGWEAITGFYRFHIFRSLSADVPELNTDIAVQTITVKRLLRSTIIGGILALVCIPICLWFLLEEWYRSLVTFGWIPVNIAVIAVLYAGVQMVIEIQQVSAITRKLKRNIPLDHNKPWKKGAFFHRLGAICLIILYLMPLFAYLARSSDILLNDYGKPLSDYQGDPPFVTIGDLCPEGEYAQKTESFGGYNIFTEYSTGAAPKSMEWKEYAEVTTPEGETYSGGIIINYHETSAKWIARGLAKEYLRLALQEKHNHEIEVPQLDVDFAGGYLLGPIQTIILQKGNVVVTASVHVEKDGENVMREWAEKMVAMLDE